MPGKHQMELSLDFSAGRMTGSGRDLVGEFTISGTYELTNGKCQFEKHYLKAHAITYKGYNEGKGIWGTWEMRLQGIVATGGFHIWPEGMADPSQPVVEEEADIPNEVDALPVEPDLLPIGV